MDIPEQMRRGAKALADTPVWRAVWRGSALERRLAERFRAGTTAAEAADMAVELRQTGTAASLDLLVAPARTELEAEVVLGHYLEAVAVLSERGLARDEEVDLTVRLGALGLHLGEAPGRLDGSVDGAGDEAQSAAARRAARVAEAAEGAGTSVTLALEPAPWTDAVLRMFARLRADHPRTAVTLDSRLHRTEADLTSLTGPGHRVRIVQGPRDQPRAVSWHDQHEADLAWVRCVKILMTGQGEPLVETDEGRLADVASVIANLDGRTVESFEYQVTLGANTEEALRLSDSGYRVRVRLPYGEGWYAEALQRMVDRPESMAGLLRPVSHPE